MSLSNVAVIRAISEDRALGSSLLFAHRHPDASPPFHVEIMDLWRSADPYVLVEAFREGAKSTLAEEFLLMEALFHNFEYCLVVGETYTKAVQRLDAIKHELAHNMRIYSLFGDMKGKLWNESKALLKNGVLLEAHGWDEEFRGFKHLQHRPDRAYLDDIENKENTRDSAAVDASMRKLYMQLIPAMDKAGKIRITGTPLADDCVVNRLKQDPRWTYGRFPICSGDIDDTATVATWPGRYPMTWIRDKRDSYAEVGMEREFNQEYMLIAAGTQGKPFTEDQIVYDDLGPAAYAPKKVIMDPARTVNAKTSDQTGKVVVSRQGTRIYVWESSAEFQKPDEILDDAFATSARHDDAQVCIEKNSLDEWLLQPMRKRMLDTGQVLDLNPVLAPQDRSKEAFILGLQPFFKAGDIILVGGKVRHKKLVAQIANFPSGKKDVLNALAYALRVFSGVPVYSEFGQVNIVEEWRLGRNDTLMLAFNQGTAGITAALVLVQGERTVVLADWLETAADPDLAVGTILRQARAMHPTKPLQAWLPGELMDQGQRCALLPALRKHRLEVIRGAYTNVARGSLSSAMRTELDGDRLFLVARAATGTLNALMDGYQHPGKSGSQPNAEPVANASRLLVESVEGLTAQLNTYKMTTQLPEGLHMGRNAQGHSYPTALRR